KLADLSERFGDGSLRTTPWRALLVQGIAVVDAVTLGEEILGLGLITDPADPSLCMSACVGAPSCLSASVDARGDARRLASALAPTRNETVHVSGCIKCCAHRGAAAL